MPSGACRALVAVLSTLALTSLIVVPVAANTDRLVEQSVATYTVDPRDRTIDVSTTFRLRNREETSYNGVSWGPIIIEEDAVPQLSNGFEIDGTRELPGPWKAIEVTTPVIEPGSGRRLTVSYTLDATEEDAPVRVDDGYLYFCVVGQDTDLGSIEVRIAGRDRYKLTQNGTPLEITERGLRSSTSSTPADLFTCVEGTVDANLQTETIIGPADREIVLQASPTDPNWLVAATRNVEPALDTIHEFLGQDIPGQGPVIIRQTPPRSLGGFASVHDTPGIVQLDDLAGTRDPEHELAHAWFGTDNFSELWLREAMAEWTATTIRGSECAPVTGNESGLDLSDWQVLRPTAGKDVEDVMATQSQAACGIVSAVRSRMGEEQWASVIRSLLKGETKYVGSAGPTTSLQTGVDYREWLDAVDEVGLVPAGHADETFAANLGELDFAQNLLADFGIPADPTVLTQRSEARAAYHQFLADADSVAAPLAVRQSMDDWEFGDAMRHLEKATEVLRELQEADALLPDAELIPVIQPFFEEAASDEDLDAVAQQAEELHALAGEVVEPLTELRAALPESWGFPAAVQDAIVEQRFDDIVAAIPPALQVVEDLNAAEEALPEARLLETYRPRFQAATSATELEDLGEEVADARSQAVRTGSLLRQLEAEVGDWSIPSAVTAGIGAGRIEGSAGILEDALAVVTAIRAADAALSATPYPPQLAAGMRPRFEAVTDAAQMAALRSEAQATRQSADVVGQAYASLDQLVPDWKKPEFVLQPLREGDLSAAASVTALAQKWIENADAADRALPEMEAIERTRAAYESAATVADLEEGAQLAEDWNVAAGSVRTAIDNSRRPLGLMDALGMWGTDVQPTVDEAIEAAVSGDVELAINRSAAVNQTLANAGSVGGLRLAGVTFFFIAVLGVVGLWIVFRRNSGPPWARQRRPHWLKDEPKPPKPPKQPRLGPGSGKLGSGRRR